MVDDIAPPKLKKVGRKRTKKVSSKSDLLKRAKRSAKRIVETQNKKVEKAQQQLISAQRSAKNKKENLKKIENALSGKETQIVEEDVLESVPETVQDLVGEREIIFQPNDGPQTEFLAAMEQEVFYGGARGGGKSYAMLVDPLRYCHKQHHRALLLRRSMPELRDLISHSQRLYTRAFPGAKWREQEKEWRFPSGARIEFGYAENLTDVLRYQGQSYTWIGIDELPQYPTPDIYNFLRSSLRSVDPEVPVFIRATGNPGNVGSTWVKNMFVDPATPNTPFTMDIETPVGMKSITRRFIPAKLQDNPYLMQTDDYMIMLSSLPDIQKKQFLEGDWEAFEGSAFPEFNRAVHVIEPFEIPNNWVRFRSADWGYSSPACCLWFAIDFDNYLYVYRELYTQKVTADIFARQVLQQEYGEYMKYGVLDSSTWAKRGDVGPSIAETMIQEGCKWRPSDRSPRSRINGKLEVHKRLYVDPDIQYPGMFIFSNCTNLIRTLPLLPTDKNNPEDVDTHAEDHAYDALRYACMSRPLHPRSLQTHWNRREENGFSPVDKTFGY
jgi:hypothetical protein|tara:strand:+ start:1319 stop:2977 length:1659 start_codon:yes stop_codon:yes gene_type:complete